MSKAIRKVQKVGEMYTRECMSRRSLNYTNGYMQAIKDVKEAFEEILDDDDDWEEGEDDD